MLLRLLLTLTVTMLFGRMLLPGVTVQPSQRSDSTAPQLDGAYEFVEETTILTKPEAITTRIEAPEWKGLWILLGDRFSQTIMKRQRKYSTYPKFHAELGHESSAGTYKIDGNTIRLKNELSLHPRRAGRPVVLRFQIDGDTLTLTETLTPYTEDLSQGQRITVLRRVNSSR